MDGREELVSEVPAAPEDLRHFVAEGVDDLVQFRDFEYGVEGALLGVDASARATQVTIPRFAAIARP